MARIETWVDCDLKKPVLMHYPKGLMFSEDNLGNLIGVNVYSDGEPATLAGSVTGYCILANGTSVPVPGFLTSNRVYITIPGSAYTVPGQIVIILKLKDNDIITTLAAVCGTVVGIGNVPADPSEETIAEWEARINATMEELRNSAVRFDVQQSLTENQKTQARNNMGANTSAVLVSGEDYRIVVP